MRKALALGTVAVAAVSVFAAQPASAAPGDTIVTFTAGTTGNTVSILPSAAVVGVTSGNTVTGTMTSVITDLRPSSGSWTAAISSSDFSLVGATSATGASLVPASSASIYNNSATVTIPGTAVPNNLHPSNSPLALSNSAQALLSATTTNVNVTTVASTLTIDVTGKNAGAYTGTLTTTVS